MRTHVLAILGLGLLAGCDSSGSEYFEAGECDPPPDGTEIAATLTALESTTCYPQLPAQIQLVGSQAEWDALFTECPVSVPAELDFATESAVVAQIHCSPLDYRFTSERADEIVLGVYSWPTGACIGNLVVVAVPRTTKPVRIAHCYQTCSGECPPLP